MDPAIFLSLASSLLAATEPVAASRCIEITSSSRRVISRPWYMTISASKPPRMAEKQLSETAADDMLANEQTWKAKLLSREHGYNRN